VTLRSTPQPDNVGGVDDGLTIGALSSRSGVAPSALRYYEAEGLLHATRTAGGQRRYPRDALRRVAFVRAAQRVGLTLDEIRDALSSLPDGRTPDRKDWANLSRRWRPRVDEQIRLLEQLRDRLEGCIGCGCLSLDACRLFNPGDEAAASGAGARYLLAGAVPVAPPDPGDQADAPSRPRRHRPS
jgi:MerR family redox-sensitive transcriptional activator SoxR